MLLEHLEEILSVLRRNKLRTLLTALSVSWGMLMLALLLGAGRGLENGVAWEFRDTALATVWVAPGQTSIPYAGRRTGRDVTFTNDDYEAIQRDIRGVENPSGRFYLWGEFQVGYGSRHSAFEVRGVFPGNRYIEKNDMIRGRFVNDADIDHRRKVAVIGSKAREILFGEADPIGKRIDLRGQSYQVVGEFEDVGGEETQKQIYVPITTAQLAYQAPGQIHTLMFTTASDKVDESQRIAEQVQSLLRVRHGVSPDDRRAIRIYNNLEQYGKIAQILSWVRVFMWLVGIGTLLAGVVGVSNIMLIAVAERTREIGIRRALGASATSIIGMIVVEAAIITSLSGYAGLVSGVFLVELASSVVKDAPFLRNPSVDLGTTLAAAGLLVLAGTLAGLFPALRAARIDPVVALREGR
jgi:putative ABC transport system permease protein